MMNNTRMTINRGSAVLFAAVLLAAGAATTYVVMRSYAGAGGPGAVVATPSNAQPSPAAPAVVSRATPLPDVVVQLSQDAVKRAGIGVAPVATGSSATEIRLPGVVEPNAYRQIVVTPLVAGRVTKVGAALGDHVRLGHTLAEIY